MTDGIERTGEMGTDGAQPRLCERCRNYIDESDRKWHPTQSVAVAIISLAVTIVVAVGGWVWFLSGQSADAHAIEKRIVTLEVQGNKRDDVLYEINERLARIEGALIGQIGKTSPK